MKKFLSVAILSFPMVSVYAATQPKFTITPLNAGGNVVQMSDASSTSVIYQVKNNTSVTRTLTTESIPGVTINPSPVGACANPFTLIPGGTCTLNLALNGSLLPLNGVSDGPKVCKTVDASNNTPSPYLCSQPSQSNQLTVGMHEPIMYLPLLQSSNIQQCSIDSITSDVVNCSNSGAAGVVPVSMALNSTHSLAYVLNYVVPVTVSVCDVDALSGNLKDCVVQNTGIDTTDSDVNIQTIVLNAQNTYAYIVGADFSAHPSLYVCGLSSTGDLTSCTNSGLSFNGWPVAMTFNTAGTLAYLSTTTNQIYTLNVNSNTGALSINDQFQASDYSGITFNSAQQALYITGPGSTISRCAVDNAGALTACTQTAIAQFSYPVGIVFNADQETFYVSNYTSGMVSTCKINPSTGAVTGCINSTTNFGANAGLEQVAIR